MQVIFILKLAAPSMESPSRWMAMLTQSPCVSGSTHFFTSSRCTSFLQITQSPLGDPRQSWCPANTSGPLFPATCSPWSNGLDFHFHVPCKLVVRIVVHGWAPKKYPHSIRLILTVSLLWHGKLLFMDFCSSLSSSFSSADLGLNLLIFLVIIEAKVTSVRHFFPNKDVKCSKLPSASHTFWRVVLSFSFRSGCFLFLLLIISLTHRLFWVCYVISKYLEIFHITFCYLFIT